MNNDTNDKKNQAINHRPSEERSNDLEFECRRKINEKEIIKFSPLPLQRTAAPPKEYPFDALGNIAGKAAERIHEVVQAPDATCGQSILGALSLATQGFIDIEIDGRRHPVSLFLLTVSESGERKSATDKIALKPIYEWQDLLIEQHKTEQNGHLNMLEIWKQRRSFAIKQLVNNPDESQLMELEKEPPAPCEGWILCEEPTLEGLERLLEKGQPSAGVFSDEGGRLIGGHAMNADNSLKTACGLCSLWDGKSINRTRKGEGSKQISGRRLSMHLMMQPIVLVRLLANDTLMGQGLLARCLFSAPLPLAGSRKYKEIDLNKDPAIQAYYKLINKMFDRPFPKKRSEQDSHKFEPGDALDPTPAILDENAKQQWINFHNETDMNMSPGGEFASIKPFASKAPEQVLRIAAIFAYIDQFETKSNDIKITGDYIQRAVQLVEYYIGEVLRILEAGTNDPNIFLANLTLEWIKKNRPDQIFPLSDVYQKGPPQIREASIAKKIMKILEQHEQVIEISDVCINEKKVRSAWRLLADDQTNRDE